MNLPAASPDSSSSSLALAALVWQLFEATAPLHGLDEAAGQTLQAAAGLYSARLPQARRKSPKAAAKAAWELAQVGAPAGLDEAERRAAAGALAVGRGWVKPKSLERFHLAGEQPRLALTLAALLRVAAALAPGQPDSPAVEITYQSPVEGAWLTLSGPAAEPAAQAVRRAARLWKRLGYPPLEVLAPDEAALRSLPFPKPAKTIGLLPDDALAEAGRKVMRFHFARMLAKEDGTRSGEDIEDLHDMRVATRRLRAAFEVFEPAFEPGALKPYLKGLRAAGRALGKVRDLDVLMEKATGWTEAGAQTADAGPQTADQSRLPSGVSRDLSPLQAHWRAERQAARAEMLALLDSREYALFKRQFNIFLNTPGAGARRVESDVPTPISVRCLAPTLIYTRLAAARAYGPYLHAAPVERLHALRIEFKKLRYTVEYFQEVLGRRAASVIEAIKALQDHLGDLNDAQVASALLEAFIADQPDASDESLAGVRAYLAYRQAERQALQADFEMTWKKHFANARFRRSLAWAVGGL